MGEINLLDLYPKTKRNIFKRKVNIDKNREIARQYGYEYFDGSREQGYGGYCYDGRWVPIAKRIIQYFDLKPGDRVLDVGCAKGFLVNDLMEVCPGLEVWGVDISKYAGDNCHPNVKNRFILASVDCLPFPDGFFNAVICINVIHNLPRTRCIEAIKEIERLSHGRSYIQVDSYRTEQERKVFLNWVLTAVTYGTPKFWREIFREASYSGDYYWTIIEIDPEWTITQTE